MSVIKKWFVTIKPGEADFVEFCFPGTKYNGYIISSRDNLSKVWNSINIHRVEDW